MSALTVEWLMYEDQTRKVKEVSRLVEMTVENLLPLAYMIQFCDDVELYGLFQAVSMIAEDIEGRNARNEVMDHLLVDFRLAALPRIEVSRMKPTATKVTSRTSSLRPESIWALQKHLIVERVFDASVEKVFDSVLPFSAPEGVPRPFTSNDFIEIAKASTIWNAVIKSPIKYREALCQRLLVLLRIPDPAPPKVIKHHITSGAKQRAKDRVMVIDKAGNAWTWNCGWVMVGENGEPHKIKPRPSKVYQRLIEVTNWTSALQGRGIPRRFPKNYSPWHQIKTRTKQRADIRQQPMGHAEFKRCIIPAEPEDYARTSFRYTRPWGQWRKGSGPVYHELFGNGILVLTDGIHAVVEFADGVKREVILENLKSIGERSASRTSTQTTDSSASTKPKTPRVTKAELSLEEMLKML